MDPDDTRLLFGQAAHGTLAESPQLGEFLHAEMLLDAGISPPAGWKTIRSAGFR